MTSHAALAEVPGLLSQERVGEAIRLIDDALRRSGLAQPRIGVCGLNPHNGDNGSFGREELDIIAPAVQKRANRGSPPTARIPPTPFSSRCRATPVPSTQW